MNRSPWTTATTTMECPVRHAKLLATASLAMTLAGCASPDSGRSAKATPTLKYTGFTGDQVIDAFKREQLAVINLTDTSNVCERTRCLQELTTDTFILTIWPTRAAAVLPGTGADSYSRDTVVLKFRGAPLTEAEKHSYMTVLAYL